MEIRLDHEIKRVPFHRHWQFCVGSGHAPLAMRADYRDQLKKVHDELGIERVRFHGILSDNTHTIDTMSDVLSALRGVDMYQEEDFYFPGVIYDNVLSAGMKPWVELSFMPRVLAENSPRGEFGNPVDKEKWQKFIYDFMKYLIHRYGQKEVESWYFEVWNEPDLKGAFYNGTQKDYFDLYRWTVEAVKKADVNLKVGGPATSGSRWVGDFTKFCKENGVPVDFISTHQYSGDPLAGVKKDDPSSAVDLEKRLSAASEMIHKKYPAGTKPLEILRGMFGDPTEQKTPEPHVFKKNAQTVQKQADGLPVFYTEWGLEATFGAYSNDTRKAACYIVETAVDVEPFVTGSSIWCFSDIFEEMHQFKEEFHGGFGLMTIHGIPKPSYYALKMMRSLGNTRILFENKDNTGDVQYAVFQKDHGYDVLVYRPYMKQLELEKERVTLSVPATWVQSGISEEVIDEDHANPLKLWEEEGSRADLTREEVQNLIRRSEMTSESVSFVSSGDMLSYDFDLGVNDVVHFHIC